MKRLHLICNAHLDPVWMWDFDEGIAAALSTFRSAADLCDEYDYIFCHNEALLYEYIEEHDPALFERIRVLVEKGKWHIMGGWYLQPDCNLPSGESLVRQIRTGRRYFKEKFGKYPTAAINFDSFGHTRGLVQILSKCGFDSYLFCRPMWNMKELPDDHFNWVGYDGSRIKCCRVGDDFMYCTGMAQAKKFIPKKAESWKDHEAGVALWGVGNHGGGPSRIDLADVTQMIKDTREYEMLHSTPERLFEDIKPAVDFDGPLTPCLVGCYTSMRSVKQAHGELENALFYTEKLCSLAQLNGKEVWDGEAFADAEKMLLNVQFHDILGGTVTQDGEKSTLMYAHHGMKKLDELKKKAFFSLIEDLAPAQPDTYPLFVYNPSPYERTAEVETEFLILDPISSDERQYYLTVKHEGKTVPSQVIKEQSNINYDRRKRITFIAALPAQSISRFDVHLSVGPREKKPVTPQGDIVFEDSVKRVVISRETGLPVSYVSEGREMLSGCAFEPQLYTDNADPWGWDFDKIGKDPVSAVLDSCKSGMFSGLENVKVIEQGDILTEVESFFRCGDSYIRLSYRLYRDLPYFDIHADVFWNEREKTLKLKVPYALKGDFACQASYGTDIFEKNGFEQTAHRFISIREGDRALSLFNRDIYGFSADEDAMYVTLLRGVAYCAHPIGSRQLIADDRYIPFMEQGKHSFDLRIAAHDVKESDNLAMEFCEKPYALNAYPAGDGGGLKAAVSLDNKAIALYSMTLNEDKSFEIRLFNNNSTEESALLTVGETSAPVTLAPYEIKTLLLSKDGFTPCESIC